MFTLENANKIVSDEGFSVEFAGLTSLRYVEGARVLSISAEALCGDPAIAVYKSQTTKWDQPAGELLSAEDKERILQNVIRAYSFKGVRVDVI